MPPRIRKIPRGVMSKLKAHSILIPVETRPLQRMYDVYPLITKVKIPENVAKRRFMRGMDRAYSKPGTAPSIVTAANMAWNKDIRFVLSKNNDYLSVDPTRTTNVKLEIFPKFDWVGDWYLKQFMRDPQLAVEALNIFRTLKANKEGVLKEISPLGVEYPTTIRDFIIIGNKLDPNEHYTLYDLPSKYKEFTTPKGKKVLFEANEAEPKNEYGWVDPFTLELIDKYGYIDII